MKYDLSKIGTYVARRRSEFKAIAFSIASLFVISTALAFHFTDKNNIASFYAGLADVILVMIFSYIIKSYTPAVLFSKEIRGVNILEDEYVLLSQKRGFKIGKASPYAVPHVRVRNHGRDRIRAGVYLRLDNGDVCVIRDLLVVHTDLYEIGDTLYKPEGVKYPVIEGREVKEQPCPLCGTVNKHTDTECKHCNIGIFK